MAIKILIVEDDTGLQTALTRALRNSDSEVQIDWVSTAEEALKHLAEPRAESQPAYNLIIADIYLAGYITGLELWQKCEASLPITPVLLMSGMGVQEFFAAIGRNVISPPFLPKPFGLGEFKQATTSLLENAKRHKTAA